LREVLLPRRMPEAKLRIPELENLQEVRTLLAERVQEWTKQWQEEGRQEGRQEGRKEAGTQLLIRQLERKFGPLDADVHQRIREADADRLLKWAEQLVTADRLTDVFR